MSEYIEHRGVRFYRYPESKHRSDRVYYTPHIHAAKAGWGRLHEEIWRDHHGPIPEGHHIHHIDGDPLNNAIENLECIDVATHAKLHTTGERLEWLREHADRVRPLTKEWHRSPEGLAWHSENGRRSWETREAAERTCEWCKETYGSLARRDSDRFCTKKCAAAHRRASGIDDETRTCGHCGADFTVNRYEKTRYCTRSCGQKARRAAETQ